MCRHAALVVIPFFILKIALNRDINGLYFSCHSDDIRQSIIRPDSAFPVRGYLTNMQKKTEPTLLASVRFLSGLIVRRADDIYPRLPCKLQPTGPAYAFSSLFD